MALWQVLVNVLYNISWWHRQTGALAWIYDADKRNRFDYIK